MYLPSALTTSASLAPTHPVAVFQQVFHTLKPDRAMALETLYADDILFVDPLHRIEGLEALRRYFARLNAGLLSGTFEFAPALIAGNAAMLPWTMHLKLKRRRQPVIVPGCSYLHFSDRIRYQRDYFDAGVLLYENVPLLGFAIRRVKALLAR